MALFKNYEMILCGDDLSEIQLTKARAEYLSRNKFNFSYCDGVQAFRIDILGGKLFVVDLIQTITYVTCTMCLLID